MTPRQPNRRLSLLLIAAATTGLTAANARAQGPDGLVREPGPQPWGDSRAAFPGAPDYASPPSAAPASRTRRWRAPPARPAPPSGPAAVFAGDQPPANAKGGECYARVKFGPQYAPPPSGPEYVWRRLPPPPGAPGPIWCLTVQPFTQPLIQPERYGWIRVLCDAQATPGRIAHLQQRLREHGDYQGTIDGRYDEETARGVTRFQLEHGIEDRGYLSYGTLDALEQQAYPPPPTAYRRGYAYGYGYAWRPPAPPPPPQRFYGATTFDTHVISWPGKVIY